MGRARTVGIGAVVVAALATGLVVYVVAIRSTSASDLGTVNSVTVDGRRGRLCVNDASDENHCREGDPLVLPAGGVVRGDCVEVRTRSRSDEVVVVRASADPCFTAYGDD